MAVSTTAMPTTVATPAVDSSNMGPIIGGVIGGIIVLAIILAVLIWRIRR